jgi:serine/threonine-protein kinase HipA
MADELAAWIYGVDVARIRQGRGEQLRLQYTDQALTAFGFGVPLLSLSLPSRSEAYSNGKTRAFVDGLLPEGEMRTSVARAVGVPQDTFSLISAIGRDCAGAVTIQPADQRAPDLESPDAVEALDDARVAALIKDLPNSPLGVNAGVRLSLAGLQEKLLLTRTQDGEWVRPQRGLPSTHILKPSSTAFEDLVENEAFCMRLASALGIPTATVDVMVFGPLKVLAVERFDRRRDSYGALERLHQEDFCQATGRLPTRKYENEGGPSLEMIAGIIQTVAEPGTVEHLLSLVVFNVVIGNADAHAKNYALLYARDFTARLAPGYDLVCTMRYPVDRRLAMKIHDVERLENVTLDHIMHEAASWGMSASVAEKRLTELLSAIPAAVGVVLRELPDVPKDIPNLVLSRSANLLAGQRASDG